MTHRIYLLAFFIFFTPVEPVSDVTGRISNGFNGAENPTVEAGTYPFIVSVTLNDNHICGGFIYNSRFIVTAASCVYQRSTSQIQVTVGQVSLILPDPDELRLQVRAITVHEAYDNTTRFNDIAMIETSQTLQFGPYVNYTQYNAPSGFIATVSGWGAFDESNVVSTKLREARTYSPDDCDLFPVDVFDPNTMFCWGRTDTGGGARPCHYDEGSPIIFQTSPTTFYVGGIVSKNLGCGDSEIFETIYTRLTAYYAWMVRTGGLQPELVTDN